MRKQLCAALCAAVCVGAGAKDRVTHNPDFTNTETILHAWSWNFPAMAENMKKIADAYGFRYLCASDDKQLLDSLDKLQSINERPVILEIFTDAETDAEVFGHICKNK